MANFYLICGISGGGKTTLSKKIHKLNPSLKVFDVDEYYAKINGDECIRDNFFKVWINLYEDLHDSEIKGEDVLLTTNALTVSQRTQFLEWFPTFKHHLLWITAPKEKCIEGNSQRKRQVPIDKLFEQWERMEFPNASEKGWDTICQITNCWDHENYIIFNLKGIIENLITIRKSVDNVNDDLISRKELLKHQTIIYDDDGIGYKVVKVKYIEKANSIK